MRTGPRDVLLFAITRPTLNTDTDGPIARRQPQKGMATPSLLRVTTTTTTKAQPNLRGNGPLGGKRNQIYISLFFYFDRAEWKKFWFVLRNSLLSLYRDHAAEDAGLAEDTVDLSQIVSVDETDSGRSYGFQLAAVDGKRHSLAALTSGIRSQWIQALRNACNQQGKMAHLPTKLVSSASAAALKAVKENVDPAGQPRREADDESLESYEGSSTEDEEEEEEELEDDDESDDESNPAGTEQPIQSLPPSPPLNRTPMSKVMTTSPSCLV